MKLFSIESNRMHLDGGSMFGHVPKTLWGTWVPVDSLNRIPLACRTLLAQTEDGRNILFDAGIGDFFEPKLKERYGIYTENKLFENLATLGVREGDIDGIVLSHLHFDHAGGLLSSYGKGSLHLLFPKAKFYLGKKHWERTQNPHIRERASFIPILTSLLNASERLVLIDGMAHPDLDFGVTFSVSDGHTKGLIVPRFDLSTGPLVFVSDVIPGLSWLHLPVAMGYDRYAELLVDEKQKILETVANQNGKLFFSHDPDRDCVQIGLDKNGKYIAAPIEIV